MKERGFFIGGLVFAMLGFISLAISVYGWVTVGFFVQDNSAAANRKALVLEEQNATNLKIGRDIVNALKELKSK